MTFSFVGLIDADGAAGAGMEPFAKSLAYSTATPTENIQTSYHTDLAVVTSVEIDVPTGAWFLSIEAYVGTTGAIDQVQVATDTSGVSATYANVIAESTLSNIFVFADCGVSRITVRNADATYPVSFRVLAFV